MRSQVLYSALLGAAVLFLVNACQKPAQPDPTLTLDQTEVAVSAEGGSCSVSYKITDPRDGAELSVAEPEVEWISNVAVSESDISFDVAANETESERSATLIVSYPGVEPDVELTVVQAAGSPAPFAIEVRDITETSAVFDVIPLDKDMYFACFNVTQDYLEDYNLTTDEALLADDKIFFDTYLQSGYTMENLVYKGDVLTDILASGLVPGTEQVIYAYGIDIDTMEPLTEIVYERFTTLPVEKLDVVFTFGEPQIDGPEVTVSITPQGYDGYWMPYVLETATIEPDETLYGQCSERWSGEMELWQQVLQFSNEEILQMLCYQGSADLRLTDLLPNTAYTIAVFAVSDDCLLVSEPSVLEVTTGSVPMSDNVIDISVSDITGSTATVTFKSSNSDPWAYDVYASSAFQGMTDEEILSACAANNPNRAIGSGSIEYSGLAPQTDYTVVAFGYDLGAVTTQLFKASFTTGEAVTGPIEFELEYDAYYDAAATVEILKAAGYENEAADVEAAVAQGVEVLLPAVPHTTPEVGTYYYAFLLDDPAYHLDDPSGYLSLLLQGGNTADWACYTLSYDQSVFAVGVAVDDLGDAGPVWVGDAVTLSKDGVSDPQGFVDFLRSVEPEAVSAQSNFADIDLPAGRTASHTPAVMVDRPVYNGGELVAVRPEGAVLPEVSGTALPDAGASGRRLFNK